MEHSTTGHMLNGDGGKTLVKRKSRRVRIPGIIGDLADGNTIIGSKVGNISKSGFNFINVPPDFHGDSHVYTIVLSKGENHYRVMAKPCWQRAREKKEREIGFKILDAPWEWVEFTMAEIPEFDYDNTPE